MCGIAGIVNFDGSLVERTRLEKMTKIISHRGPDGEGHWLQGPVGLGHRRLSIIDLSTEANQPMISQDDNLIIVFNGEIYNYKELAKKVASKGLPCRTDSDTEVILNLYKLYGVKCLSYLRGMFAFAVWDKTSQNLFLARDRVGIKPLYFLHSNRGFVFGSEIKAVAASGYSRLNINKDALSGFFRFLVVPQPESIFDDICKLEPGCFLLVQPDGSMKKDVYWTVNKTYSCSELRTEENYIFELERLLKDSVDYHMVADVPVGAFLSGGLDSSAIVSIMREQVPIKQIDAFSIGFPGQAEYDEDKYARNVAQLKRLNFYTDSIDESFLNDYEQITWHLDEPFAISSAYATYYLAKHAAKKTKVVLTGDGGDELFAGYEGYKNNSYQNSKVLSSVYAASFNILFSLVRNLNKSSMISNRLLTGLRRHSGTEGLRYSEQVAQNSLHANSMVLSRDLFFTSLISWGNNLMAHYYDELDTSDSLHKKLYAEYKTRLVDEMLMKVDRMTMAHSLEARVPLLDHNIVEFAFNLPSTMKLHNKNNGELISKYILKKSMESYLPHEIIYRKKQGFNLPVKNWLKGTFLKTVGEKVLDGNLRKLGLIDIGGVENLIKHQSDSQHNYNNMLLILLALETWINVSQERLGQITFN